MTLPSSLQMYCHWMLLLLFGLIYLTFATIERNEDPERLVIIEGDIALTQGQYRQKLQRSIHRHRRMAVREEGRWRNATIWYTIALTTYTEDQIVEMRSAFDQFEQETCLKFRPATGNTSNYLMIRLGNTGCSAQLGQAYDKPAAQFVNLGTGCRHYGLYLHEFGHSIGLYHEHQHPDRDSELKIHMDNVKPSMREWFKHETDSFETFGAPYDIQSVMHYGDKAFGIDKKITMTTKNPKLQKFLIPVWLKDLSFYDAWKINAMYKCASHCDYVDCPQDTFVNKDCQCVTKKDFAKRRCVDQRPDCGRWKDKCASERHWMWIYCRKTCDKCYEAI